MPRLLAASALRTSPGSYLYSIAAEAGSDILATIASDNSLTFFDRDLRVHASATNAHNGITCVEAYGRGFATAGRDGAVRCWDARARRTAVEMTSPRGSALSAVACCENLIAAGSESTAEGLADVDVLLFDVRNTQTPLRTYKDSHTDSVTQLRFAPEVPHVLASAADDGLVTFFDARIAEEEDALLTVLNPRAGVHCAGFLDLRHLYVATADESFLIYPLSGLSAEQIDVSTDDRPAHEFGDVRPQLQCSYIVDVLPNGTGSPLMVVGDNNRGTLEIIQLDEQRDYAFGAKLSLPGAHGDDVVRGVFVQEAHGRAFTCGEDGMARVWDLAASANAMDVDMRT